MAYIEDIDIMEDIKMLESTFKFRPICLRNIRISTLLLKRGAEAGLNLAQIGQILCRPDDDDSVESLLEKLVIKARQNADFIVNKIIREKDSLLRNLDFVLHENDEKDDFDKNGNGKKLNGGLALSSSTEQRELSAFEDADTSYHKRANR